jgi:thiamine pyrophosphate-dependent acetolactate synthase large subunit-like protein
MKLIELLNTPISQELIDKGALSLKYKNYIDVFNTYKKHKPSCKSMRQAIMLTSIEHKIGDTTVFNIIKALDR